MFSNTLRPGFTRIGDNNAKPEGSLHDVGLDASGTSILIDAKCFVSRVGVGRTCIGYGTGGAVPEHISRPVSPDVSEMFGKFEDALLLSVLP